MSVRAALLVVVLGGCGFHTSSPADLAGSDLAGVDLAGVDLAGVDLAVGDLAAADLAPAGERPPPVPKRVFVTREVYAGSLGMGLGGSGGVLGGDLICTTSAGAAGLGGTWRAWLSDSNNDAIDRIVGDGPWQRLDGQLAFPNHASLALGPAVPLNLDQTGAQLSPDSAVWSGTTSSGLRYTSASAGGGNCADWTSKAGGVGQSDDYGMQGDADYTTAIWTQSMESGCYLDLHLYCFEQ